MYRNLLAFLCILVSFGTGAQPWVRKFTIGSSGNPSSWRKMIQTYDGGIAMLVTTENALYLLKLDKNGKELQRKMLIPKRPSDAFFYCNGFAEDRDHGLIITGVINDSSSNLGVKIKLNPCYELDQLSAFQDSIIGFADVVPYENHIVEVAMHDFDGSSNGPLMVTSVDRDADTFLKRQAFLSRNNPIIENVRKVKDGFAVIGYGYFFQPPPESTRWIRSYILYFDSNANLVNQRIFYDSTLQFSVGRDVEYYDGHFYVLNVLKDSSRRNVHVYPEIVKMNASFEIEKRIELKPDTLSFDAFQMTRIGSHLFIIGDYYPDDSKESNDSRSFIYRFDLTDNTYITHVVDSMRNESSDGGVIKTSNDKLVFMYRRSYSGNINPDMILYRFLPNLALDSFAIDTSLYNHTCQADMDIRTITLVTDTFLHTGQYELLNPLLVVSVYPNPTAGTLTISHQGTINKEYHLRLFDVTGRCLYDKILRDLKTSVDLSAFRSGTYHLLIEDSDSGTICVRKIIKI